MALLTCVSKGDDWGSYQGQPSVILGSGERQVTLTADFVYIGPPPKSQKWIAQKGKTVDGASIPRIFWSIIGPPLDGNYLYASIFHDVACDEKTHSWQDVHLMFYQAMRCSGVPVAKAKTMYWAVYHFGPRWSTPNPIARLFGATGVELPNSESQARSLWSTGKESWSRKSRTPSTESSNELEDDAQPGNPATISKEDILRFERWVTDENPSLVELEKKRP